MTSRDTKLQQCFASQTRANQTLWVPIRPSRIHRKAGGSPRGAEVIVIAAILGGDGVTARCQSRGGDWRSDVKGKSVEVGGGGVIKKRYGHSCHASVGIRTVH